MSATVRPGAGSASQLRYKVHKGRRTVPGADARVDTLMGMVMALMSEVSVLRERVDAHERLNAEQKPVTPASVDDFVPDELATRARAVVRQRMIEKVCRPLLAAGSTEAGKDDDGEDEE